jgi:hypothetical protein
LILAIVSVVLMLDKQDLTLADLGRHIKNGEVILHGTAEEKHAVLHTNFYSCATPTFPFINHHWLTGVLFYFLWTKFSFEGLSIFYAALIAATVLIFYFAAERAANATIAAPLAALALAVLSQRTEVRPEGISFLFMAIFYAILSAWFRGALNTGYLYFLPLLMLLWVNFHIGFVFGFLLLGTFFLKALLAGDRKKLVLLLAVTAASIIAGCVNPSGLTGFLYPLSIYRNFGYTVGESRSLFVFLGLHDANPEWQLKLFAWVLLMAAAIAALWWIVTKEVRPRLPELLLLASTAILAISAVRNIPVFSLLMIPLLSELLHDVLEKKHLSAIPWIRNLATAVFVVGLGFCWIRHQDREQAGVFGLGLKDGATASADFMQANAITGPVFNDFNNGSYLIFNLFHPGGSLQSTTGRVFLDQRPEAYPSDLFDLHKQMEADDNVWRQQDEKYHFNAIVYSLQFNNAPETERFLLARVRDPEWAPVYTDNFNLIYLRRTDRNAAVIKVHELPRSMFR